VSSLTSAFFPFPLQIFTLAVLLPLYSVPAITALQKTPSTQIISANRTQRQISATHLEAGQPTEKALAGGQADRFEIHVKAGKLLHVVVSQLGIDVALTLFGPDAKQIESIDSQNSTFGLEQLSTVAKTSGIYTIEVASSDKGVPAGHYRITVDPFRDPDDQDRARISAEQIVSEIPLLPALQSAESLRNALQRYEEALPLWQKAGDAYQEAMTLRAMGDIAITMSQKESALKYYEKALQLDRNCSDPIGEAETLSDIGVAYDSLGEGQRALDAYQQALTLEQRTGDQSSEAVTLNNLAYIYYESGAREKALENYNKSLALRRVAGDKAGQAETLNGLGAVYLAMGQPKKALDYFSEALTLERALGDRNAEGLTLNNLGALSQKLGDRQQALNYYNQTLLIERASGDREHESISLNNIGNVYSSLGEKRKALNYFSESLALSTSAEDRTGEAVTLSNMGLEYDDLGEKHKALDYFGKALLLMRALGNRPGEATTLNNIGRLYDSIGQHQIALDYFNQALVIKREVGDKDGEAVTLGNLGWTAKDLGQNQKSLDYFNEALEVSRKTGGRTEEARMIRSIGELYLTMGDSESALVYYNKALPIERVVGDREGEALNLALLGQIYSRAGDKTAALLYYNQSAQLSRLLENPMVEGIVLHHLMVYWQELQNYPVAILFGKQAVNAFQRVRRNLRGLDPESLRSFVTSRQYAYRELAALLIAQGRLPEAEQVLELLKNEEYLEFILRDESQAASLNTPVGLTKQEEELNGEYQETSSSVTAASDEWVALRAKTLRTPEEEKRLADLTDQLKSANMAWDKFIRGLYDERGKSADAQSTIQNVQESASGMQRVLHEIGPGAVALYTLVSDEKYHVIIVTSNVMVAREYPIKAVDLRKKVFEFRQSLANPGSDPAPQAKALYRILVGPVEGDLRGAKAETLMWSLDDVLRYIPMAALHDGQQYLVEKYRNEIFTPTSIPSLTERPSVTGWRGLGMGVSKSYGKFSALPAVPKELDGIIRDKDIPDANGVLPGQLMLDETFTEDGMKKALEQNYAIVHVASHFAFVPGNDTDSFLLLGGKDRQGEHLSLSEIRTDPAFSFADTELLTLSACATAVGGTTGDGREIDGLGMLAQRKGARAVIASLWGVYDQSTGLLMQKFYEGWISHPDITKAGALREAQLLLLHGPLDEVGRNQLGKKDSRPVYAHPFFWAPFILIGNWQ
jgi:CHAT domain-containing protein/Tfp pilus assembly protein PilF